MTDRELDVLMRRLLTRMLTLSYGKVQSFSSSNRGGERDPRPSGEAFPLHEKWARFYEQARSLDGKRLVYEEAKAELEAWQGRTERRVVDSVEEERWILEDGEGYEPEAVALRFRCSVTRVRKLRLAAGRDMESGKRFVTDHRDDVDVKAHVLALRDKGGYSLRMIEMITGASKSAVHRLTRKAA